MRCVCVSISLLLLMWRFAHGLCSACIRPSIMLCKWSCKHQEVCACVCSIRSSTRFKHKSEHNNAKCNYKNTWCGKWPHVCTACTHCTHIRTRQISYISQIIPYSMCAMCDSKLVWTAVTKSIVGSIWKSLIKIQRRLQLNNVNMYNDFYQFSPEFVALFVGKCQT